MLMQFFQDWFFLHMSIKLDMTPSNAKKTLEELNERVQKDENEIHNLSPFMFNTYMQFKEFNQLKSIL